MALKVHCAKNKFRFAAWPPFPASHQILDRKLWFLLSTESVFHLSFCLSINTSQRSVWHSLGFYFFSLMESWLYVVSNQILKKLKKSCKEVSHQASLKIHNTYNWKILRMTFLENLKKKNKNYTQTTQKIYWLSISGIYYYKFLQYRLYIVQGSTLYKGAELHYKGAKNMYKGINYYWKTYKGARYKGVCSTGEL